MDRLTCPVTGTPVAEAFGAEQRALQPPPTMAKPFDVVSRRDCLISFEKRRYSVPFAWVGRKLDIWITLVRGTGAELARPTRGTETRLLISPDYYEGPPTRDVEQPTPAPPGRAVERFTGLFVGDTG